MMLSDAKILLVEDDEDDYLITKLILEEIQGDDLNLAWVRDYESGLQHLAECDVHACLVDYRIGARTGLEFVGVAKSRGIRCPMIIMTGVGHHDIDVAAAEAGAFDFIDKSDLSANLLERSLRYAIANAKSLQTLAAQSSLLETTLEYSGAGIAAIDSSNNLTTCNKQFEELLRMVAEVHFPNSHDCSADALEYLIAGLSKSEGNELGFKDGSGRDFEIRRNRTPHNDLVLFSIDVTEHKILEAKLMQAKADIQAASRAKSAFLANMTHEFRTPLHGIIGFSDIIMQSAKTDDIREFVQHISESSAHLLEIINKVLAFSRLEAGEHPHEDTELLELNCLVEFCINQVRADAVNRKVDILSEIDPRLFSLRCDVTSVRQILINLLSNAVRFSFEAGKIMVSAKVSSDGRLCLAVRDYGVGMTCDEADLALLPFRQVGEGHDRQSSGTGLGLPIVKSLAELHDAEMTLETAPQKGTCVMVAFPANRVNLRQTLDAAMGALREYYQ